MLRRLSLLDWLGLAALIALAVPLAGRPLSHDDLFWHLESGAWMAEHGTVPRTDPFSFTRPGAPWVTHEWGFSLLVYGIWLLGGYPALIAARVLLVLAIGGVLARVMARVMVREEDNGPSYLSTALLAIGLWTVSRELILRAALVSELFLAFTLLLIARYRRNGRPRELAFLVGLFWLWANIHSGVIFGLFVLGLFTLEALVFRRREARPWLLTFGASALVSLVNPNGVETLLYPWRLSRILFASGIRWDLGHFEASSPAANSGLLILGVLLLAGLLPLRKVPVSLAEILGIVTFTVLVFRSPRFVFHVAILALPVIYRLWADRKPMPHARWLVPGAAIAAALVAWTGFEGRLLATGLPEPAARFVQEHGIRGRLFNHQNNGGYLLWRLKEPVFWDGRNDVFASLVQEYVATPFPEIAERYGIEWALVTEHEWQGLSPELDGGRWGLVYWDDFRAVYLRRIPRFEPLLARMELRMVPAFGGLPGLQEIPKTPPLAAAVRAELDRVLADNPETQRALYFRAVLSLGEGKKEDAVRDLRTALAIRPTEQVSRMLAAVINLK